MVVHAQYPLGEPRVEREARAAVEAGHRVDVICLRAAGEPARATIEGIQVRRLPIEHLRGAGASHVIREYLGFTFRAAVETARLHRQHPLDVVHVHAPPDFLILSALIPRLRGSGVVLDIHDLSPDMFAARFGTRQTARVVEGCLRLVERTACALADRVITVHDAYSRELAAHGVPRERIEVVMNAVETEAVRRARATVPATDEGFVVAYHGTITDWYGVDLLVQAVAHLERRIPAIRALVLGDGDALPSVEELARRLGIESRFRFSRAYLPHNDVLGAVANASCGVIPNRPTRLNRFALSSKLLEYVALGIPVVVARLETLAAHFSDDEVTFFTPGDAGSLAEAIAWIAEHPLEAREKVDRARERAEAYSWPASRARLLATLAAAAPQNL
jgi:glycosyltransferase involved in cell wall biosynthesis